MKGAPDGHPGDRAAGADLPVLARRPVRASAPLTKTGHMARRTQNGSRGIPPRLPVAENSWSRSPGEPVSWLAWR